MEAAPVERLGEITGGVGGWGQYTGEGANYSIRNRKYGFAVSKEHVTAVLRDRPGLW